jgi:hypothetical protein
VSVDQLRPLIRELAKTCEEHAFSWMLNQEPSVADLKVDIPEIVNVYVQSAALIGGGLVQRPGVGVQLFRHTG